MMLERIESPSDLKHLSLNELEQLCSEIRQRLIETVNHNGGHLASNLGVVELTVGLHRVFNSPRDKIVWDVSHQTYVHKLLTGRRDSFPTIRQYGGLSGFSNREESPHDHFGAGHASTSISAALGMALARDLSGKEHHVVAVIGDGALTGGMAFEAINHAGHLGKRLTVILNDNGMAISPNVGALSKLLQRIRLDPRYAQVKERTSRLAGRFPRLGPLLKLGQAAKEGFKRQLLPTFWEELGFAYIGPVNGHSLEELEEALRWAKLYSRKPTLVHVLTQKGKGYPPAESDAVSFHGVPPPSREKAVPSFSQVFGQTVLKLFRQNPRVVAITAAMLEGTGLKPVAKEFPERVFDVGICEQHAVTLAAGLATQGLVPIVAIYSTFLQRAYDQLIHDVCLQNLPVVFAIDRAGIVGDDGKTHQGAFDLSYLGCVPNLVIAAPRDENELQHLLFTAVKSGQPMALRYPRGSGWGTPLEAELRELPLGKGEVLREGTDLAILAIGSAVYPALSAAESLSQEGIECQVVDLRFAKPLDSELVLGSARLGRLIVVEENAVAGGVGGRVLQLLAESGTTSVKAVCLGLPDQFIPHGPQALLRSLCGLDAEGIAQKARASFPELERSGRRAKRGVKLGGLE